MTHGIYICDGCENPTVKAHVVNTKVFLQPDRPVVIALCHRCNCPEAVGALVKKAEELSRSPKHRRGKSEEKD